jgi:ATP-binding cassette subfamily F protein uup
LNKEKTALIELPGQIEKMEAERDRITALMQEADYYRNAKNDPESDQSKLEQLENEILRAYETWEKLETLA